SPPVEMRGPRSKAMRARTLARERPHVAYEPRHAAMMAGMAESGSDQDEPTSPTGDPPRITSDDAFAQTVAPTSQPDGSQSPTKSTSQERPLTAMETEHTLAAPSQARTARFPGRAQVELTALPTVSSTHYDSDK